MRLEIAAALLGALVAGLLASACAGDDDGPPGNASPGASVSALVATASPTAASPQSATVTAAASVTSPTVAPTQPAPASTPVTPASGAATPTPTATAVPTVVPAGPREVTVADNRTTVIVAVGTEVLVRLGEAYTWDVTTNNPAVLGVVTGATVPTGVQALYRALAPGSALIRATGDPVCRRATPACGMPSIEVEVTIVVR
ncbi:MAG: hypothetical protein IT304_10010 [Dehalococcoidia bacterium]|nr:hypothetical protein [Dehalococcoidia bacterium]